MRAFAIVVLAAMVQARPDYSSGGYSSGGYSSGGYSSGINSLSLGGDIDGYSASGGYNLGSSGGYDYAPRAPLVTKHVYVHVAPEEPEAPRSVRIQAPGQHRKHYKIVFIKAPSAPAPAGASIQLPQQDEEKTLIYVLSKKEEQNAEINIQAAPASRPTKPEVYFIRYRTQKGAAPTTSYGPPVGPPSTSYGTPTAPGNSY